jgi:DNA-binding transcriptional ArsR family regulator
MFLYFNKLQNMMSKRDALAALGALAQESRLDVFRLLVRAGERGVAAGAIAGALGLAAPTLSFHLKELRQAGLVRVRRDGRSLVYGPDFAAMRRLLAYLTDQCCQGAPTAPRPPARGRREGDPSCASSSPSTSATSTRPSPTTPGCSESP